MSEWKTFQASPVQVNLKPWNPVYALGHPAHRSSGGHWTCPEDLCRSTPCGPWSLPSPQSGRDTTWSQLLVIMQLGTKRSNIRLNPMQLPIFNYF